MIVQEREVVKGAQRVQPIVCSSHVVGLIIRCWRDCFQAPPHGSWGAQGDPEEVTNQRHPALHGQSMDVMGSASICNCFDSPQIVIVSPPMFENARNEEESESVTEGPHWHTKMSADSLLCLPVFMFYATNWINYRQTFRARGYTRRTIWSASWKPGMTTRSQNQDRFHILFGQICYFAHIVLDTVSILKRRVSGLCV